MVVLSSFKQKVVGNFLNKHSKMSKTSIMTSLVKKCHVTKRKLRVKCIIKNEKVRIVQLLKFWEMVKPDVSFMLPICQINKDLMQWNVSLRLTKLLNCVTWWQFNESHLLMKTSNKIFLHECLCFTLYKRGT